MTSVSQGQGELWPTGRLLRWSKGTNPRERFGQQGSTARDPAKYHTHARGCKPSRSGVVGADCLGASSETAREARQAPPIAERPQRQHVRALRSAHGLTGTRRSFGRPSLRVSSSMLPMTLTWGGSYARSSRPSPACALWFRSRSIISPFLLLPATLYRHPPWRKMDDIPRAKPSILKLTHYQTGQGDSKRQLATSWLTSAPPRRRLPRGRP